MSRTTLIRSSAVLSLLVLPACAALPPGQLYLSQVAPPASAPRRPSLQDHVAVLAHDSMGGREVGTAGARAAADYLSREAARLRLRPLQPGGSFLHPVALRRRRVEAELELTAGGTSRRLDAAQAVSVSGLGGLPESARTEGGGRVVYAGFLYDVAIRESELTLADLDGAVVVVQLGTPNGGAVPDTAAPRLPLATLFSPQSRAAAVLLVHQDGEEDFWKYAQEVARRGLVERDAPAQPAGGPRFFLVSRALARELLGGSPADARQPRRSLGEFRYAVREKREPLEGWNVIAVLPGSDPERAGEYVAIGAHYDHVGVGDAVAGDSIYNGADDDASGSAVLLEVAERLRDLPAEQAPRRSVLFAWHTAEEHGLLGADALLADASFPREAVVAQVNLDMVGRNHPDSLFSVGSRRISPALGELVEAVNGRGSRPFRLDYRYDDPADPEQLYCRSDHYAYARAGIPVVFFTSGLHADYHQPSDEVESLDYGKLGRVAGLVHELAGELARMPDRLPAQRLAGSTSHCM